jgi:hypothetical protein
MAACRPVQVIDGQPLLGKEADLRDDGLPDLRPLRPESFVGRSPTWGGPDLLAFEAREPGDFDWMERMLLTHGYYEHEGVWDLALGFDKHLPWVPKLLVDGSQDARELGIALESVELRNEPVEEPRTGAGARWTGIFSRLRALAQPVAFRP